MTWIVAPPFDEPLGQRIATTVEPSGLVRAR